VAFLVSFFTGIHDGHFVCLGRKLVYYLNSSINTKIGDQLFGIHGECEANAQKNPYEFMGFPPHK